MQKYSLQKYRIIKNKLAELIKNLLFSLAV